MTPAQFLTLIENAGFRARSYSGRGIHGKSCVGIDLDRNESAFSVGATLALQAMAELADNCEQFLPEKLAELRVCEDTMGLGRILYFPSMAWPGKADEE